jgi:anti-anti-sigma regulatory factor
MGRGLLKKERQAGTVTVLELSGQVASGGAAEVLDLKLQNVITGGARGVLINGSRVRAFDFHGIQAFARAVISIANRNGKLKLVRISATFRQALADVNMLSVIEIFDDERTDLGSFGFYCRSK